jgi:hypothetical protein
MRALFDEYGASVLKGADSPTHRVGEKGQGRFHYVFNRDPQAMFAEFFKGDTGMARRVRRCVCGCSPAFTETAPRCTYAARTTSRLTAYARRVCGTPPRSLSGLGLSDIFGGPDLDMLHDSFRGGAKTHTRERASTSPETVETVVTVTLRCTLVRPTTGQPVRCRPAGCRPEDSGKHVRPTI